ncbi:MAG: flagellar basal-body rod protein FlgF [bacterium]
MIKGLYTAASSMTSTQKDLNIVSNNLANSNTTGFKKDIAVKESFPEMLINKLEGKTKNPIGTLGTGVRLQGTFTDFSRGQMRNTENAFDFAIQGEGFFVIETPNGTHYTRDGNFTLNETGELITQQGYRVLGKDGPIQVDSNIDVKVDEQGRFFVGGLESEQLQIRHFNDPSVLSKTGDNLYTSNVEGEIAENIVVKQGYLEGSNIDTVQEMVKMIEVNRLYESNQKVVQSIDGTLDKAVNQVGRLRV